MKILNVAIVIFCLISFEFTIQAQNAFTSGGNASGSGGSVSYSVGQVVYATNIGSGGSVAQGVQQPYEISVPTGLEDAKDINLVFLAYPNPTVDILILKIGNYDNNSLSYMLYDINAKILENKKVTGSQTHITMGNLFPGTYFLKIVAGRKEIKTFKIIKN